MKKFHIAFIFSLLLLIGHQQIFAQPTSTTNWTWIAGANRTLLMPVYGTQHVSAATNIIGAREGASYWKDASGNLWMYGGYGFGFDCSGTLSDLWKYTSSTNEWTWVNGSQREVVAAVYGSIGVPSAANTPGGRTLATTWIDASGNLWLFGGSKENFAFKSDLWEYDISTNMWTWVKGDSTNDQIGVYGVQGVPANNNKPGARADANGWVDASGNLWMFGGDQNSLYSDSWGGSDLWRYNPVTNQWTWMKGPTTQNQPGNYGVQGVAAPSNYPGGRNRSMSCTDLNGNFWLFGGYTAGTYFNDLWKFEPLTNNWTWVKGSTSSSTTPFYGTLGIPNASNTPAGRYAGSLWADTSGNLLTWGGVGYGYSTGYLNELWKFNISTNQWAWIKGAQIADQTPNHGVLGIPNATNDPGGRYNFVAVPDASGGLCLVGGYSYYYQPNNDVWKYNISANQWVWIKGDSSGAYVQTSGTQGVSNQANNPGSTENMVSWTDLAGNLWGFGGADGGGYYNTVWKYNPDINEWTWVKGSAASNKYGVYGTKGVPAPANTPGSRQGVTKWVDAAGNLYIFGGEGYLLSPNQGTTNELWKYDISTNQWVWLNGDNHPDVYGVYGTMGVPSSANTPGARGESYTWIDNNGDLWLFGGWGYASSTFPNAQGYCTDIWKYTISTNQWTWVNGASTTTFPGTYSIYNTMGVESPNNYLSGRSNGVSWMDATGNLWIYGGNGYAAYGTGSGALSDMWRYNMATGRWTWMKGDTITYAHATYGIQGIESAANNPGGNGASTNFKDENGNIWLVGGSGPPGGQINLFRSTLWKLNTTTHNLTWVKGDTTFNQYGVYGTKGATSGTSKPGARASANIWYANGNCWMHGGYGTGSDIRGAQQGQYYTLNTCGLNDLWILGIVPTYPDTVRMCQNGTASLVSDITGTTYQWQQYTGNSYANISDNSNFSGTATSTLQLINIPATWNGYIYRCVVNGSQNSKKFRLFIVAVTGTVSTVATSCSGVNDGKITVTATGGVSPFTFSLDGGTFQNANIFTGVSSGSHTVVIKDLVQCTKSIPVNVSSGGGSVVPSVSITSSASTICVGTIVTFTATPVNGGASPSFQWQVNGFVTGNNSNTFTTVSLNNNDQVKAILTSSLTCAVPATATSNIITMTVTPPAIANAGNDTVICSGSTAQLHGSGGTIYSWTPVTGLNNPNIANPIASPLTTTRYFLTVNGGSGNCGTTDSVLVTVNQATAASVNISTPNTNICSGTSTTFTAVAAGAGSGATYQWKVNGVNAGTNSNTFTTNSLSNNDQVKVILTSSLPCVTPQTVTSNIITMLVTSGTSANAGNDITICAGGSAQLQGSGGSDYLWSPATGLSNPTIANPIASPASTTIYVLTVSNGGNCISHDTIVVTVGQSFTPTVSISTPGANICSGTAATFTATATNGGASPAYQWQVNGVNAGANSNIFTSSSLQNNDQVKAILTSSLACVVSSNATSNVITVSVQQLATPLLSLSNHVFTVINPDNAAAYTWQKLTNTTWANVVPAATGITYTAPAAGEYRVKAVKGPCTLYSASQVTSIVSPTSHFIYLHPNPASSTITLDSINLAKKYETVEITDIAGKRVLPVFNIINQVSITIDISMLSGGSYMAIVRQGDGTYSALRFIKL